MKIFQRPTPAPQPAATDPKPVEEEHKHSKAEIAKRVGAGLGLLATGVGLTGCGGGGDLPDVKLPAQNLDAYTQDLPAEARSQDALAHSVSQYENGQEPYLQINASELYSTVTKDAAQVTANPGQAANVEKELVDVVVKTHAAIHAETDDYIQAKVAAEKAHDAQGFHIVDSKEVKDLKAKVDLIKDHLIEMRGIAGAADITLTYDNTLTGGELSGKVDEAAKAVATARAGTDNAAWINAIKAQLQLNNGVKTAQLSTQKEQARRTGDAVDFKAYRGDAKGTEHEILKAGLNEVVSATSLNASLTALKTTSENNSYESINQLLKVENNQYRITRETYDSLKAVHDLLPKAQTAAKAADDALRHAEQAITYRNAVAMEEPPYYTTIEEPQYDNNGNYTGTVTRQVESQAHKDWEWRYDTASTQAAFSSESAEQRVHELNNVVGELKGAMRAGNVSGNLPSINGQINWFLGENWSWGIWSWDSNQVNDMERQIGTLEVNLGVMQGQVDTTYHNAETSVWNAIHAREAALLK